jgi:hypothetical protein
MARFEKEQLVLGKAYSHDLGAEVQCANCKKTEHVKDILCRCDRPYHFTAKRDANGKLGLSCNNCKTGSGVWTCAKCSKTTMWTKTFAGQKAGLCFVATAAFGAADAQKSCIFLTFATKFKSIDFGRAFIRAYVRNFSLFRINYRFVGIFACLGSRFFLAPIIRFLQNFSIRMKKL